MNDPRTPGPVERTLRGARDLIADPAHWTCEAMARDARGFWTSPYDTKARRFCSAGAVKRVTGVDDLAFSYASEALSEITLRRWKVRLARANDTRSHVEILSVFDEAIAVAKRRES